MRVTPRCSPASSNRRRRVRADAGRATRILRRVAQTVLQRVKRGELDAVHVHHGKRKGLRIKVIDDQATLFGHSPLVRGQYDDGSNVIMEED